MRLKLEVFMFYHRIELPEIQRHISKDEITLVTGARQVGKTSILHKLEQELTAKGETTFFLNLEDVDYLSLLNEHPHNLFKIIPPINENKKYYVFIDEVQYLDNPTNFLKLIYDEYRQNIKLIVSGSSAFYIDKKFKDSLAGRKRIFTLYSLNFRNFLIFKQCEDLLKYLPDSFAPENHNRLQNIPLVMKNKISRLFSEYFIYGGYPRVVTEQNGQEKQYILEELVTSYIKKDLADAHIKRYETYYRLLKIFASQTGQLVNCNELAATLGVSNTLIENYTYIMQKSFHIALITPFFQNIRKELTKMPKVFFYDHGLRNYLLNDFSAIETRELKGTALENIAFKQLLGSFPLDRIHFWRSLDKKEIDFVIDENLAFEVKYDYKRVKKKPIESFLETYPDISIGIITLDSLTHFQNIPVWPAWGI